MEAENRLEGYHEDLSSNIRVTRLPFETEAQTLKLYFNLLICLNFLHFIYLFVFSEIQ